MVALCTRMVGSSLCLFPGGTHPPELTGLCSQELGSGLSQGPGPNLSLRGPALQLELGQGSLYATKFRGLGLRAGMSLIPHCLWAHQACGLAPTSLLYFSLKWS